MAMTMAPLSQRPIKSILETKAINHFTHWMHNVNRCVQIKGCNILFMNTLILWWFLAFLFDAWKTCFSFYFFFHSRSCFDSGITSFFRFLCQSNNDDNFHLILSSLVSIYRFNLNIKWKTKILLQSVDIHILDANNGNEGLFWFL